MPTGFFSSFTLAIKWSPKAFVWPAASPCDARSNSAKLLAIPPQVAPSPEEILSCRVSPRQISLQVSAPPNARDASRLACTSRKAAPLPTVHEKPLALQTLYRRRRTDQTAEAIHPGVRSKTQSNSKATARRRCVPLPEPSVTTTGTWARPFHALEEPAPTLHSQPPTPYSARNRSATY